MTGKRRRRMTSSSSLPPHPRHSRLILVTPASSSSLPPHPRHSRLILVTPASSSSLPRRRESRIRVQQQRQITAAAPEPAHLRGSSCRGNSLGGYPLHDRKSTRLNS